MNRRLSGRRTAAIAAVGLLCPFWVAPQAQAEDDEAVIEIEDIFVVGTRRPERVLDNLELVRVEIPSAFWDELRDRELIRADAPVPD